MESEKSTLNYTTTAAATEDPHYPGAVGRLESESHATHSPSTSSTSSTSSTFETESTSEIESMNTDTKMTDTAAITGDPQSTAAQQVFGLPELLENILLHVSFSKEDAEARTDLGYLECYYDHEPKRILCHKYHLRPNPVTDLFIFQRVNSVFRATIARNKILQQRMFLAPYPRGTFGPNTHNTIRWLGEHIGIYNNELDCGLFYDLDQEHFDISRRRSAPRFNDGPEASWRRMKLHPIEGCEPISVDCTTWETSEGEISQDVNMGKFEYGGGMTLGKLYDGLQKLIPFIDDYEGQQHWQVVCDGYYRLVEECGRVDLWQ